MRTGRRSNTRTIAAMIRTGQRLTFRRRRTAWLRLPAVLCLARAPARTPCRYCWSWEPPTLPIGSTPIRTSVAAVRGSLSCPSTGLMHSSGQGYKVFAINFSNAQGDNYQWAQSIADAIEVVRQRTGASKVNLLAWSKGAFAARTYVASVAPSWGRSYQQDAQTDSPGWSHGGLTIRSAHGAEGDALAYLGMRRHQWSHRAYQHITC